MSVRPIHLLGSATLRERAAEVERVDEDTRRLVQDLFDTMRADKGIGLAANQIGELRRVAVVHAGEDTDPVVLINPVIVERAGTHVAEEGCLSIPEIFADVKRAARVVVETLTESGERRRMEVTELAARAIQHEVDHLNGTLFIDHLSPLKRRLLLRKWERLRKGKAGYLKELPAATEA
ncbi:MAG TPA: peptide deformylase [Gemmatimonadales bacterium]